ncbi:response regulator [Salinicola rhizosphaerae]|uniref:histidine kinase n=1 Tax=Salinicola rhizosphaerae TaxID=1443141 RepID=A0ABQ3DQL8_9GAMM|nr:response regulator [Salinicola rhizosphaerae]GHB08283.1 hypothetical protein GCM10009038_02150 [Salinicola rhizosphaerae]
MVVRWLIRTSMVSGIALMGVTGWHAWQQQVANDQILDRRLESINRVFTPSLSQAVEQRNREAIDELLARLTRDPAIVTATLRNADGEVLNSSGDTALPPPMSLSNELSISTTGDLRRWVQPLSASMLAATIDPVWLDLALDSSQARAEPTRWPDRVAFLLSLLLLAVAALAAKVQRRRARDNLAADRDVSAAHEPPPSDRQLRHASHELRAPISGLLGFCRLLENSPLDVQQRDWLRQIHLASSGLLDTVDEVLGDRRRDRACQTFDIAELLWQLLCLQAPLAHARNLTLVTVVYDDVPPRLTGPQGSVRQLLMNLINNAVKYSEDGDVVVRVVLESRGEESVRLRLSVSDEGTVGGGEDRQRLARALAAPDDTDGHDAEAGVGIAICRHLVSELGGSLALSPRPEKGTTIVATIELQASPPFVRPAEFDLEGAEIALWQPHARLAHLIDYALKRWNARPRQLTEPNSVLSLGSRESLAIIGIGHDDLAPQNSTVWQRRFDDMSSPCLLLVNASPTQALDWRLPAGSEVVRLPMSRYIFGKTLAKMLAQERRAASPPRPRVLVVDDDEISQHYLDSLLSIADIDARVAGSAVEAEALAREGDVDLVFMDLNLPDANGFDVVSRLRGLGGRWRQIPVFAMTAAPGAHQHRSLAEHGIEELLAKPLSEPTLASILRRHLPETQAENIASPPFEMARLEALDTAAVPNHGDLPVVDRQASRKVTGDREALAEEMRNLLIAELPNSRRQLYAAWQRRDREALQNAVHQLHGGCRYCGVPQLTAACETLERFCQTAGADAGMSTCREPLRDVISACDRLLAWAEDRLITET